jgi:coproporphyrinogen III oxidase
MTSAQRVADLLHAQQDQLVREFEAADGGAAFRQAPWCRPELGRGTARILERGRVFERAGVNVSYVHGDQVPDALAQTHPGVRGKPFVATGISTVLHPVNPYVPSFHANFRYFEVGQGAEAWWFGGGADLTPSYGFEEDAIHFHTTLMECCNRLDPRWYPVWKATCDRYFYLPHRGEMRGIGGIFFDRLSGADGVTWQQALDFVSDAVGTLTQAYLPIVRRRSHMPYEERQRRWQLLRRGRYAEFNLLYDRGTRFGLQTRGNTEAILMSLPPQAGWAFEADPEPGSAESDTARFLQPLDWAKQAAACTPSSAPPGRPGRRPARPPGRGLAGTGSPGGGGPRREEVRR